MPTVRELKQNLTDNYHDDDVIAYALWSAGDIYRIEGRRGVGVPTVEEINATLDRMHKEYDANNGMTWDDLREALRATMENK